MQWCNGALVCFNWVLEKKLIFGLFCEQCASAKMEWFNEGSSIIYLLTFELIFKIAEICFNFSCEKCSAAIKWQASIIVAPQLGYKVFISECCLNNLLSKPAVLFLLMFASPQIKNNQLNLTFCVFLRAACVTPGIRVSQVENCWYKQCAAVNTIPFNFLMQAVCCS